MINKTLKPRVALNPDIDYFPGDTEVNLPAESSRDDLLAAKHFAAQERIKRAYGLAGRTVVAPNISDAMAAAQKAAKVTRGYKKLCGPMSPAVAQVLTPVIGLLGARYSGQGSNSVRLERGRIINRLKGLMLEIDWPDFIEVEGRRCLLEGMVWLDFMTAVDWRDRNTSTENLRREHTYVLAHTVKIDGKTYRDAVGLAISSIEDATREIVDYALAEALRDVAITVHAAPQRPPEPEGMIDCPALGNAISKLQGGGS